MWQSRQLLSLSRCKNFSMSCIWKVHLYCGASNECPSCLPLVWFLLFNQKRSTNWQIYAEPCVCSLPVHALTGFMCFMSVSFLLFLGWCWDNRNTRKGHCSKAESLYCFGRRSAKAMGIWGSHKETILSCQTTWTCSAEKLERVSWLWIKQWWS